ncbi:MAG: biopolymer transporter ExbD [Verrucomicrobiales bacterium]
MKIPRKKFEAAIPALAMGDIAFLLLIFFVILARAQDDSHLRWKPAQEKEVLPAGGAIASVVIDADRRLHLNGREITAEVLDDQLRALLGDRPTGKRTVLLKVDKDTPAEAFEPAIEAISLAGGDLVHVLEPEETR